MVPSCLPSKTHSSPFLRSSAPACLPTPLGHRFPGSRALPTHGIIQPSGQARSAIPYGFSRAPTVSADPSQDRRAIVRPHARSPVTRSQASRPGASATTRKPDCRRFRLSALRRGGTTPRPLFALAHPASPDAHYARYAPRFVSSFHRRPVPHRTPALVSRQSGIAFHRPPTACPDIPAGDRHLPSQPACIIP
jgi:hypothetical protein